jgi:hypothetical protein
MNVEGELKTYEYKGDSGKPVYHCFCPEWGSVREVLQNPLRKRAAMAGW